MRQRWLFVALFVAGPALAGDTPQSVLGTWASETSVIEISEKDGRLHAEIVAIRDPVYREDEAGAAGTPRLDDKNPDAALRGRPIVGIDLLSEYQLDDGRWRGRIYDPESGKTYSSQMQVKDGRLQMRGYIGTPMLGRTVVFEPVASCKSHIVAMMSAASLVSNCG